MCLMRVVPKGSQTIPCPMCRCETLLPENGVAGLKDNFFILNLSDAFTSRKEDNQNRKAFCTVCPGSGPAEATSRCLECVDFLCDGCASTHDHRIARFTRRHRVISLTDNGQTAASKNVRTEAPCSKHDTETLRFFCETCEVPICRDCILIEHKDHTHTYLKDEVTKYKNLIENLMRDVKVKVSSFQDAVDDVEEVEANLIANKGQTEYIIQKTVESVVEALKKQEKELVVKLERICMSRLKQLAAHKDSLKSSLENLTDGFDFTEKALEHGSDLEILSIKDQVVDRLQGISKISPQKDLTLERLSQLYFIPNDALTDPVSYALGEIKYENRENGTTSDSQLTIQEMTKEQQELEKKQIERKAAEMRKTKLMYELNDSTHEGGEFDWPSGVASTEDGEYVVITDRDNDRIQIYNRDGKFECKFGSRGKRNGQFELPLDVAISEEDEPCVYITDEYNHRVQKFTLYGRYMFHFGDNGTLKQPYGIAVDNKKGRIVVTDIGWHRVTIHDLDGKLIHKFGSRGDESCKFNEPRYVAMDDNRIIISDHCNHCVKIFDTSGKYIHTIGSCGTGRGQFIGPTGVCIDNRGNIIVADCADRVQLFSPEGEFIRLIVSEVDGISGPLGMAITQDGLLVVTNLGTHKVNTFKYSN
ncbi:uncharacterized protein LOC100376608 [Saccoglossus kowalevskii]|uniref:Tripartite motif-containing protein 2-like n=1 Tax=Saccoglossus kowalevskii TaxID=10224 RepID=A0ABM0GIV0_SACKO|nr:PREDICTED: tripartite motif-containing protein 2-like [Saccoglossus kowalevskii]